MDKKAQLREVTVGKAPQLSESVVEYEGLEFYCRELPYTEKQGVMKKARKFVQGDDGEMELDYNQAEYELSLLVRCVYDGPRSDSSASRVFSNADRDRLEQEGGRKDGWLALLIDEVTELNNAGNVKETSEKSD